MAFLFSSAQITKKDVAGDATLLAAQPNNGVSMLPNNGALTSTLPSVLALPPIL